MDDHSLINMGMWFFGCLSLVAYDAIARYDDNTLPMSLLRFPLLLTGIYLIARQATIYYIGQ